MPLNSTPCTVNAAEFDRKRAALENTSITDFGLWGGLVPGNVGEMAELADRGVVGFKAFMCDSGLPEFPRADDDTLFEGLRTPRAVSSPVAVHAENHELTTALSRRMIGQNRSSIRDFLDSRPVIAEVEAIQRAAMFAGEARAKLHIVHVSSGRGVAAAAVARARGVDVSIETCPHYLFFTEEDVEMFGAVAKCTPPIRTTNDQNALWTELIAGRVDIVASDHSPAPPELKTGDFWKCWGGIAGAQSTLAVLLDRGFHQRGVPLDRIAALLSANPAKRFQIPHKGSLRIGNDADLVLVDLPASSTLRAEALHQRHRISPYIGNSFRGSVRQTIRRGETIFHNGEITAKTCGKLLHPSKEYSCTNSD